MRLEPLDFCTCHRSTSWNLLTSESNHLDPTDPFWTSHHTMLDSSMKISSCYKLVNFAFTTFGFLYLPHVSGLPLNVCLPDLNPFFKLNLLGWHCLIKLHRFQVYISMIHDAHVACVPTTQSKIIFHHHIVGPLYYFQPSFPLVAVTLLCLWVSVLYPTYKWNHMVHT